MGIMILVQLRCFQSQSEPLVFAEHAGLSTLLIAHQTNLKDKWDELWSDPIAMTLVNYRNICVMHVNNCLASGALKPVQDGPTVDCCPDSIHYLSVNTNNTFPDSNECICVVQSLELLQAVQVVTCANGAVVTLNTYIGDNPLTVTQAQFKVSVLDTMDHDKPVTLLPPVSGST